MRRKLEADVSVLDLRRLQRQSEEEIILCFLHRLRSGQGHKRERGHKIERSLERLPQCDSDVLISEVIQKWHVWAIRSTVDEQDQVRIVLIADIIRARIKLVELPI